MEHATPAAFTSAKASLSYPEPTGRVLSFPGTPAPQAEKPATPARNARKAPSDNATGPDFLAKHLFVMAALADPSLSDRGKVMLAVIVEEYRADWGCAKRSHAHLAGRAGTSERTGRRAVDDCVRAGWLRKHVDRKGKDSEVNTYWPIWEKAATMRPDVATAPAETCGQMWPQGMAKDGHTVWPDVAYESHLDSTERTTVGETASPSPNAKARLRDSSAVTPNPHASQWVEPAQVDRWWEAFRAAYPNEAGLDHAKGTFCRIVLAKEATAAEIIAGARRYTDQVDQQHGQAANASAWLTSARWREDFELATPAHRASSLAPVTITAKWKPSRVAWVKAVKMIGREQAQEVLDTFRDLREGSSVHDPDTVWLRDCEPV